MKNTTSFRRPKDQLKIVAYYMQHRRLRFIHKAVIHRLQQDVKVSRKKPHGKTIEIPWKSENPIKNHGKNRWSSMATRKKKM